MITENTQTSSSTSVESRRSKTQIRRLLLVALACFVFAAIFIFAAKYDRNFDANDPRRVMLEKVTQLEPSLASLPDDDVSGIRPGQTKEEAAQFFKSNYWGNPYEKKGISIRGSISSQFYVRQLFDIGGDADVESIAYADLSSPATGSVVVSTMLHNEYKGLTGYPTATDVETNLVEKYGKPTHRFEWISGGALTLIWVRGEGSCSNCKYWAYPAPRRDDANGLIALGIPLEPVIIAEIQLRKTNLSKVSQLTVRVTDYGMIAKDFDAATPAIEKAQTKYDSLSGPKIKF